MKALIVDDSEVQRDKIKNWLKEEGTDSHQSVNGKEGLQAFKEQDFQLIILDQTMPIMTGIEMLTNIRNDIIDQAVSENHLTLEQQQRLQAKDGYKDPESLEFSKNFMKKNLGTVVMLTADVGTIEMDEAAFLGVSYWIMKPIDQTSFLNLIKKVRAEYES